MPDIPLLLSLLAMLLAIGAFAGLLAGLLGVGGGLILVPAFFYAFSALGYDSPQLMQVCLATSLATIIVTSVRSVLSHNRKGAVDWAVLRGWAPGIAIGAVIGVLVAAMLRSVVLQGIFGVLGVGAGLYLAFGRQDWRFGDAMPVGLPRLAISMTVGFLAVLMGIGGGHVRRAADDIVRQADPQGGGDGGGFRRSDRRAVGSELHAGHDPRRGAAARYPWGGQPSGLRRCHRDDAADCAFGGAPCPSAGPETAAAGVCVLCDCRGRQHAAEGAGALIPAT
ncbi:membrane protein [Rhodovulum sp. P5]|nr:membrane protein [Rhodovulum sp. P5]